MGKSIAVVHLKLLSQWIFEELEARGVNEIHFSEDENFYNVVPEDLVFTNLGSKIEVEVGSTKDDIDFLMLDLERGALSGLPVSEHFFELMKKLVNKVINERN